MLAWYHFETPSYLALLALLPLIVALSVRSLAGLGPVRRWFAITARCLVLLTMILALAGAQRTQRLDNLTVVFLIDRSRSVPDDWQRRAVDFLRAAGERRPIDDRVGVIAFDGTADVEQTPMRTVALQALSPPVAPDQTNLAGAARMALALLPSDTAGRIVLITDGNENAGDILSEAQRLAAAGVPIDVVPILYEHTNEIVFESLKAPPLAATDEAVNLQLVVQSQRPTTGRILLRHNGRVLDLNPSNPTDAGYRVQLDAGRNRFVLKQELVEAGANRFEAEFVPDHPADDTIIANNTGQAFTLVSGQGRILILAPAAEVNVAGSSARILQQALTRERVVAEVEGAGERVLDQVELLEYSAVVLANVPANDLRESERQVLATYVRELGGGLIMLGGAGSFGAGGWMGSPVEEVMPLSFDIKHKRQFIKGALVLVMHACEIERGNYIGERCAIEAVKTLSSRDLIGITAWRWFDDTRHHWVVPLQEVGDRSAIIHAIRTMSMGDAPDLDPMMRPGVEAMIARQDVGPKHMIVISDFDPAPPRDDLLDLMAKHGITCSTIPIGYGGHFVDEAKAREIAQRTGGRCYPTRDFDKLPQIFVKESREIRRDLIQEVRFTPRLVGPTSPLTPGLAGTGLPDLKGFVLTTAKPLAEIPIVRPGEDGDDPVLAHWQVGLGKTVAFTSGEWPSWGSDWAGWDMFSKFWAQTLRWVSRQSDAAAFDVTTTVYGGTARIRIDALDQNADVINFMEVAGVVVDPSQAATPLRLTQTGPGRYEAEFDARERGNFIVNLSYRMGQGASAVSGSLRTGVSVAYSPEYSQLQANRSLLEELAQRTRGRVLDIQQGATAFDRTNLPRAEARLAMWESLLRWMLLLFLIDVAIRRIAINPAEVARRLRRFIAEMAGRERPTAQSEAVLSTLKGTRERVRDERAAHDAPLEAGTPPDRSARYVPPTSDHQATEDLSRALGGATEQDAPVVARPTGKKPAQSEGDYTSRLLKAKKRVREDLEQRSDENAP